MAARSDSAATLGLLCLLVSSPRLQTVWLYRKIIRQTLGNTSMIARASWKSAVCTNISFTTGKTVPEHQSPLCQTAQQLFAPGCESPELKSPAPLWNPMQIPYLLKHGPLPTLPHHRKKNCQTFLCNSKCATHRWVGLYKPPVNTLSSIRTRHFYTLLCVHKYHKNSVIYLCLYAHALQITLHCSPASCLNVSLFAHVQYLRGICTVVEFLFFSLCIGNHFYI